MWNVRITIRRSMAMIAVAAVLMWGIIMTRRSLEYKRLASWNATLERMARFQENSYRKGEAHCLALQQNWRELQRIDESYEQRRRLGSANSEAETNQYSGSQADGGPDPSGTQAPGAQETFRRSRFGPPVGSAQPREIEFLNTASQEVTTDSRAAGVAGGPADSAKLPSGEQPRAGTEPLPAACGITASPPTRHPPDDVTASAGWVAGAAKWADEAADFRKKATDQSRWAEYFAALRRTYERASWAPWRSIKLPPAPGEQYRPW